MAVDTVRRVKKTASRLEHALLLQPITTAMSYGSSNHIPEINAQLADTNAMRIPAEHLESKPTLTGQNSITQSQPQSSKKRRSSKSKVPSELRRSTSTPHMRNLALGNSGELSPTSNKPRNKLGYHRTSVACGKPAGAARLLVSKNTDGLSQDTVGEGKSDVSSPRMTLKADVRIASA